MICLLGNCRSGHNSGIAGWFLSTGHTPAIDSIAISPLANKSDDPEQEYFAEGMTDELITNLGKIGALRMINVARE